MAANRNLNKGKITREHFVKAKKGDQLKDNSGRLWDIVNNLGGNDFPSLLVKCPGHDTEEIKLSPDLGIIDEEWGTIRELNHPTAEFVSNQ